MYTRNEGSSLFSLILPTPLGFAAITVMHGHSHCLVVSLSGPAATKHSQLFVKYDYSCHSCMKPVTYIQRLVLQVCTAIQILPRVNKERGILSVFLQKCRTRSRPSLSVAIRVQQFRHQGCWVV